MHRHIVALVLASLLGPGLALAQDEDRPEADDVADGADGTEAAAESDGDEDLGADPDTDWDEDEAWEEDDESGDYEPVTDPSAGIGVALTACEGRRIDRIRVRGNRRVSDDDILATIRLRTGRTCRDDLVSRDARTLWDQGFFDDIRIDAQRVSDDRVTLSFTVQERPAIGRVSFEGNDNLEDTALEEEVDLAVNGIFSRGDVRDQVTKIRDKYAEEGFYLVRVDYRLRPMSNNRVEVVFQVREGQRVTVRRVRFVGNRTLSASQLQSIMATRATGFFSFIANDDRFNRDNFDQDTIRLQAYYYDQGYLAMQVGTPRIELTEDGSQIDVTVPIREGPRFRIGRLSVTERGEGGETAELLGGRRTVRNLVPVQPGEWFNRTQIAQGLLGVTRHYRDAGFAYVDVVPETSLNSENRTVDVNVVITRGPPVTIERIQIRGNTKTADSVIRREMAIREGDLYSQSNAEISRQRVQALGYFERVDFSEERGSAADRIIVQVEIAERATGQFQVGAGFSSLESFILTGQIQQQNLFGTGQSLSLQLQLSGIRQSGQLQFVEPYFLDTTWTFGFDVFRTVRQFAFFSRDSTGGSVTLGHPLFGDPRLRVFVAYRAELVQIGSATGGLFGTGGNFNQAFGNLFRELPLENLFRNGLTSSLRLTATFDGRDNRLFPSDGFFFSYSAELADEVIGSENTFVRHNLDVRGYTPVLLPGVVLRARGVAGLVTSRFSNGVPVFERYFLGGIFNVRGFPLNRLGPLVGLPANTDPNAETQVSGIPVGGNFQLFYNLELEFPILQEVGIRGVVFTDGGNVWNLDDNLCQSRLSLASTQATDPCRVNLLDLRTSVGFGVRWVSPLGPLRFEFGIPFNRQAALGENALDFQFTIGNFF